MFNNDYYSYYNYNSYKPNIFNRLINNKVKINWSTFLNNTQKTLNIINQAIPVVYQIKPMYNNAKTIFKVISAVRTTDNIDNIDNADKKEKAKVSNNTFTSNDSPTFFL